MASTKERKGQNDERTKPCTSMFFGLLWNAAIRSDGGCCRHTTYESLLCNKRGILRFSVIGTAQDGQRVGIHRFSIEIFC